MPLEQMNDLVMLIADEEADSIKNTLAMMRRTVSPERKAAMRVINSEYGIAHNDIAPNYQPSIAQALYTATILFECIEQDVPVGSKHSLTGGVIGNAPHFLKTPTAYMFKLFSKHFGTIRIASSVENNPTWTAVSDNKRKLHNNGVLEKLKVNATKDEAGNVYIMVVNRHRTDAVNVTLDLSNYTLTDKNAGVLTLNGDSYVAYNSVEKPDNVIITETKLTVNNTFDYTFPAHSITTIKLKGKVK
jgi:alpha-N-arabinofuranosidase